MVRLVSTEDLDGSDLSVAIAVSRFNTLITERLLAGALEGLAALGVREERTTVAWVPGSFELPLRGAALRRERALRRRDLPGLRDQGRDRPQRVHQPRDGAGAAKTWGARPGVPAIFGVVTANSLEQALARAEEGSTNKGYEAAMAAVTMANLRRRLAEG